MTVEELVARFPEIPADLRSEPILARFAESFEDLLVVARKPSPCSTGHDGPNHFYLKLIGPLAIHAYGLSTKDKALEEIRALLDRFEADPEGFPRSLLPDDAADAEIRGPGCD